MPPISTEMLCMLVLCLVIVNGLRSASDTARSCLCSSSGRKDPFLQSVATRRSFLCQVEQDTATRVCTTRLWARDSFLDRNFNINDDDDKNYEDDEEDEEDEGEEEEENIADLSIEDLVSRASAEKNKATQLVQEEERRKRKEVTKRRKDKGKFKFKRDPVSPFCCITKPTSRSIIYLSL